VSPTHRRLLQAVIGTAVSVGCGWLAIRNVDWNEVGTALRDAQYV
jgi:hypothetical protein